ncbi:hypothetical protein YB2330_000753 [Saitoella coloradoensis]
MGKRNNSSNAGGLPVFASDTKKAAKAVVLKKAQKVRRTGFVAWIGWYVTRITALYTLYMIIFSCPTDPSSTDPAVCRRYAAVRDFIHPHAEPLYRSHVQPYTDPYLQKAAPYVEKGHHYYSTYGAPAVQKAHTHYWDIAHPRILSGAAKAQKEFKERAKPLVQKHLVQRLEPYYERYLAGYVRRVKTDYTTLRDDVILPQARVASAKANVAYHSHVLPAYRRAEPIVKRVTAKTHAFYLAEVHPRLVSALHRVLDWINLHIVPRVKVLYITHVQPQFDRISDRIFRYKQEKAVVDQIVEEAKTSASELAVSASSSYLESLSSSAFATPLASYVSEGVEAMISAKTERDSILSSQIPEATPEISIEIAREQMKMWRQTVQSEADNQKEVLAERAMEIVQEGLDRCEEVAEQRFIELRGLADAEIETVEETLKSIPETNVEARQAVIATAGKAIHAKSLDVRQTVPQLRTATNARVIALRDSTINTADTLVQRALEEMGRILGYEIEVGVTAKDWTEYHKLRKLGRATEDKLLEISTGVMTRGHEWSNLEKQVEKEVNAIAADAANRLDILKGHKSIFEAVKEAVVGAPVPVETEQAFTQSIVSVATEAIGDAAASFTSVVAAAMEPSAIASAAQDASAKILAAAEGAQELVFHPKVQAAIDGAQSELANAVQRASEVASQAVYGYPQGSVESIASIASEKVFGTPEAQALHEKVVSKASEVVMGTPQPFTESVMSKASEAVYGTEESFVGSVTSIVGEQASAASSILSVQYSHAAEVVDDGAHYMASVAAAASDKVKGAYVAASQALQHAEEAGSWADRIATSAFQSASSAAAAVPVEASGAFAAATGQASEAYDRAFHAAERASRSAVSAAAAATSSQGVIESLASVASVKVIGEEIETPTSRFVERAASSVVEEIEHATEKAKAFIRDEL